MEPHNLRDGKNPDGMINDFRALLENTQDATQCVTIDNGTREFLKHKRRKKTSICDEQLHAMELCIYHGIKVKVEGSDGERISQICRYTASHRWGGGDRPNNCVWVNQCPGRCWDALNVRLPWQLQGLFKIKLLNENGAFIEYWLALALSTIPEHSGNLDPVSKFVQVWRAPAADALDVLSVGNIVGCTHLTREIGTSSMTGDGRNVPWIVNCHIDLATWNDV